MFREHLSSIEELIEEARSGRMFILVDAEDRENEGDLVIPAQMCTPQAVNFMAKYGRGLICLALTSDRAETLQIPMIAHTRYLLRLIPRRGRPTSSRRGMCFR